MTGIYLITNMVNGKRYVGQSVNIERRFWDHNRPRSKSLISRAIRKHGKASFRREVLEQCSVDELDAREIYWIKELAPEYNISQGHIRVGFDHCLPESSRSIISEKAKLQWALLPDDKKKQIVENQLIGPMKGHTVPEETREKLRKANLGKKQSVETVHKRKNTWDSKVANGWTKSGEGHYKKVLCVDSGVVYKSVKDAAVAIGAHPSGITSVLKGRQLRCRGLHFKYCGVETIRDECSEVGLG